MPSAYILIHVARRDPDALMRAVEQVPAKVKAIIERPPASCDAPEDPDLLRDSLGVVIGSVQLLIPRD